MYKYDADLSQCFRIPTMLLDFVNYAIGYAWFYKMGEEMSAYDFWKLSPFDALESNFSISVFTNLKNFFISYLSLIYFT